MAQKSIISLIQSVAAELNLPTPVTVLSNQDQNVQKMLYLARAVCDDLIAEYDWQGLQTRYTFTTVNGQESYTLPTSMERYISGTFFDQNSRWPLQGPKTPVEWEWIKASNFVAAPFTQFRVFGNAIHLAPTPGTSTYTFNLEYISNVYVNDGNSGLPKADFTQDSDICSFDHRVVIYGIKLKWRESIGQDTTAVLADYKRALEYSKGSDAPAQALSLDGHSGYRTLSTANYPESNWG